MRLQACALLLQAALGSALRLQGTFQSGQFFKFLAKYGFQQTHKTDAANTEGYIYGNITAAQPGHLENLTLVLVDSEYMVHYYAKVVAKHSCSSMFEKIDQIAWGGYCKPNGVEDFLRRVPCKEGELCVDETDPTNVQSGHQFTYRIQDVQRPRFWYLSIVSCSRPEPACSWNDSSLPSFDVRYDIWLVNGPPDHSSSNPFEHQFSFEMHDVFEIYAVFAAFDLSLLVAALYAVRARPHPLIVLLTAVVALDTAATLADLLHTVVFAFDGVGSVALSNAAQLGGVSARCLFMLTLLLIAKGWTITFKALAGKAPLFVVWSLYSVAYLMLRVWNLFVVDPVADVDEWQTWPGYLTLAFRFVMMMWFLYALLKTYAAEDQVEKHQFYVRFGAGFLVWFIYLPIVVLIGTAVPTLWRFKTLLSLQLGANSFFLVILLHLMWPGSGPTYFTIGKGVGNGQQPPPLLKKLARMIRRGGRSNGETLGLVTVPEDDDDESSADELYMRQVAVNATYTAPAGSADAAGIAAAESGAIGSRGSLSPRPG